MSCEGKAIQGKSHKESFITNSQSKLEIKSKPAFNNNRLLRKESQKQYSIQVHKGNKRTISSQNRKRLRATQTVFYSFVPSLC